MRLHLQVEIAEAVDAAGGGQALGQVHRRQPAVRGGLQVTLRAGPSESIGEVSQVVLPVSGEGLVEQSDSPVEQRRRSIRLAQPQQTLTRTGRDICWSHPVQPVRITIRLKPLDLRARLGEGCRAP